MPELPEVETTRLAIIPYLQSKTIKQVIIRHHQLRLPIPNNLDSICAGQTINAITRRAKYLLLQLPRHYLIIHLGMSGHLKILPIDTPIGKHDHIDLQVDNIILRYHDPRRFGLWLCIEEEPSNHPLLKHLGPEPLSADFNADYLINRLKNKNKSIKSILMTNEIVVGVGNIYATESLYLAGINPLTSANRLTELDCRLLVDVIKQVLTQAIAAGGTTLRDFYVLDGKPGYFSTHLNVYGRHNKPCLHCQNMIERIKIAGRSSTFCPACQPLMKTE